MNHIENIVQSLPVEKIIPNRHQPRLSFYEDSLRELASSIKENGLLQPVVVREITEGYELIAGERRYRAVKLLGYTSIPALIIDKNDNESADLALIENMQREGLSAIEEAIAIQHILQTRKITQAKLAKRLGYQQSTLANKLRLLKLNDEVKEALAKNQLSERHARALLKLSTDEQAVVAKLISEKNYTVKETEEYVDSYLSRYEKRNKGVTNSVRIGMNTVKQAYDLCRKSGLDVSLQETEYTNEVKLTIRFRK